jgi:hypothetical protein
LGLPTRRRPSQFTEALAAQVLWTIASGVAIRNLTAKEHGVKGHTVLYWAQERPDFAQQLARAREIAAHMIADEGLMIADDESRDSIDGIPNHAAVQRARLRSDYRKWLAGKWNAAAYADKQVHTGPDGQSAIQVEHSYNLSQLTPAELAEFQRLLHKCRAPLIEG